MLLFIQMQKLAKKIIDQCNAINEKEDLTQRQSYKRVSKHLLNKPIIETILSVEKSPQVKNDRW